MKYNNLMKRIKPTDLYQWTKDNQAEWDDIFIEMVKVSHELTFNPTTLVRLPDYTLTNTTRYGEIDLKDLAKSTCSGKYFVFSEVCVLFENEDDALLFKLNWVPNEN